MTSVETATARGEGPSIDRKVSIADSQVSVSTVRPGRSDTVLSFTRPPMTTGSVSGSSNSIRHQNSVYTLTYTNFLSHRNDSVKSIGQGQSKTPASLLSSLVFYLFFAEGQERALGMEAQKAVLLAFNQAVVMVILESIILAFLCLFVVPTVSVAGENKKAAFLLVYVCLYIIGQVFQAVLVFDAVSLVCLSFRNIYSLKKQAKSKNTMQVIGTAAFNIGMAAYAAIQVFQIYQLKVGEVSVSSKTTEHNYWLSQAYPVSIVALVVMVIFSVWGAFLAYKVYKEYGWNVFETTGASLEKRRMLRTYNIFALLLELSIYFNFGIVVQVIAAVLLDEMDNTTPTVPIQDAAVWSVAILLILMAVVYYHLGRRAVTTCSYALMISFLVMISVNIVGYAVGLIYVRDARFRFTIFFLSFFVYFTIGLNVATFCYGVFCWSYFKDGLGDLSEFCWSSCEAEVVYFSHRVLV